MAELEERKEQIRLLLVDDESVFRNNIARLLTTREMRVFQAEDGEAALAVLCREHVPVVLLDVKMPKMSGLEVLRRIKETHSGTEVILLTGESSARDGVEGIKAGAFDYLGKPVEIDHLAGKIRQAYEKIRMEETRRREAEFRKKMETRMAAAERLASLGTLAAGVAHEINNPLAVIKQSVTWLSLRLDSNGDSVLRDRESLTKALAHIETAVDRARRITHQLLGAARKSENQWVEVELDNMTGEAVELVAQTASDAGVHITRKNDARLKTVWSNPGSLRQVMTNLLINAIHATAKDGKVVLATEDFDDDYAITVEDTGSGIPEEDLDRIFEPFFTTKPAGEGTGLGLFVTRSILDALGGSISVESRLGRGSRFSARLAKVPRKVAG